MSDLDRPVDAPATPEEAQEARRLAEAIEGGRAEGADPEALAVVRLLESVAPAAENEVGARGLRTRLVRSGAAQPRLFALRRVAAVAAIAAAALAGALLLRSQAHTGASALAAREEAARAAVAAVVGSWGSDAGSSTRIAAVSERLWRERLVDRPESERLEQLASESSSATATDGKASSTGSTRTNPTPGGSS